MFVRYMFISAIDTLEILIKTIAIAHISPNRCNIDAMMLCIDVCKSSGIMKSAALMYHPMCSTRCVVRF